MSKFWSMKRSRGEFKLGNKRWHSASITVVEVMSNGNMISASSDGTVCVWDLETGKRLNHLRGHADRVNAIAVTKDGKVVSASNDMTLKVWNLESGRDSHYLQQGQPAESKRPCPDPVALLREASANCDPGTSGGESRDNMQNTKSEFAADGLRSAR